MSSLQKTKPGEPYHLGGLTDVAVRHPGVYLDCPTKGLGAQIRFAYDEIMKITGIKQKQDNPSGPEGSKLWMKAIYKGQEVIIECFRKIPYQEWQLTVSSKNGLDESKLEKLADQIFSRIAKPETERKMDKHKLRLQY